MTYCPNCGKPLVTEMDHKHGLCFGCKAKSLQYRIPEYMSWKGDTQAAQDTVKGIKEKVASDPQAYHQSGTRWV